MDILDVLLVPVRHSYHGVLYLYEFSIDSISKSFLVDLFPSLALSHNVLVLLILSAILCGLLVISFFWNIKPKVQIPVSLPETPKHFRKRDKIRYHANRFRRKFSGIADQITKSQSKEEKKEVIVRFVKSLFQLNDEHKSHTLAYRRLPESFFEPDEGEDTSLPEDLRLMISSIRVFGHLEKSSFISFFKFIETRELNTNDFLFRIGDEDVYVYVIRSGKIQIRIRENDGTYSVISEVTKGGSVDSLLSVLHVLIGHPLIHDSIEAIATEPTTVLCLPTRSFTEICQPETSPLIRVIQMVCVRLQRLSFTTSHSHFGLSAELMKQDCLPDVACSEARSSLLRLIKELPEFEREVALNIDATISTDIKKPSTSEQLSHLPSNRGSRPVEPSQVPNGSESQSRSSNNDFILLVSSMLKRGEAPYSRRGSYLPRRHSSSSSTNQKRCSTDFHSSMLFGKIQSQMSCMNQESARWKRTLYKDTDFLKNSRISVLVEQITRAAERDFARLFKLDDPVCLRGMVDLVCVPENTILSKELEMQEEIFLVLSGKVLGLQTVAGSSSGDVTTMFVCHPGDVAGLMGFVTSEPNIYSLHVPVKSFLAMLCREKFYSVVRQYPHVLFVAYHLVSLRMSPLLHHLDFALEWVSIKAGKALYKKGDVANHVYVILSGRLRQVDQLADGSRRIVGELGRGDLVGFLEVVSSQPRVYTAMAIRDSEVAQIPSLLLQYLKKKVPQVMTRIIELLSDTLLGNLTTTPAITNPLGMPIFNVTHPLYVSSPGLNKDSTANSDNNLMQMGHGAMTNLRTIAVLPATSDINAEAFTLELQHSMSVIGSSIRLTSSIVLKILGSNAFDSVSQYRLSAWLSHQEDAHRIVFFVCDFNRASVWNRLCIRQADCLLVLALASADPMRPSPMEMALKNDPTKVAKTLVLMYPIDTDYPKSGRTAMWLNARPWISQHYHIRCEPRVFTRRSGDKLISFYSLVFAREKPNPLSDFSRLARYLSGEAVGLVLGGGGARGCSHIGIIRAFQEAGIPIDLIGGTSIGAFMGALWAEETRVAQFTQRARNFTNVLSSVWNKLKDITYPAVSLFSGKEFNRHIEAVFRDRQIEDLWIPYFTVTTDISNCKMRIHTQGSIWRYVRGSMTYALENPPICDPFDGHMLVDGSISNNVPGSVWRYIRSSMSLSGYLPPLCDPYDGSLLLDGGYTNNVPADIMSSFGASIIFAIDVGATVETDLTNYGDYLSGWYLLYRRLFCFNSSSFRVPSLTEIQARLAYISCVRQLEYVKESGICHYIRPPIDRFMTLQFGSFDEILTVGYEHALGLINTWREENKLQDYVPAVWPLISSGYATAPNQDINWIAPKLDNQAAFVDLAEFVNRSDQTQSSTTGDFGTKDEFIDFYNDLLGPTESINSDTWATPCSSSKPSSSKTNHEYFSKPRLSSDNHYLLDHPLDASIPFSQNRRRAFSEIFNHVPKLDLINSVDESKDESDTEGHDNRPVDGMHLKDSHFRRNSLSDFPSNSNNRVVNQSVLNTNMSWHGGPFPLPLEERLDNLCKPSLEDDGYMEDNESESDSGHSLIVASDPEFKNDYGNFNTESPLGPTGRTRSQSATRFGRKSPSRLSNGACSRGAATNPRRPSLSLHEPEKRPSKPGEEGKRFGVEKKSKNAIQVLTKDRGERRVRLRKLHHRSSLDRLHPMRLSSNNDDSSHNWSK